MANLFARKPLDRLMHEAQEVGEHSLKRSLGPVNLVALGIGAIIGAGLFVRTAAAIADRAGPSVVLAFIVAGLGCVRIRALRDPPAEKHIEDVEGITRAPKRTLLPADFAVRIVLRAFFGVA